jgi:beta-glucosidase
MANVDDAVSRILRIKFRLGLFDKPYADVVPETERYLQPKDKEQVQKLAEESIVLLKNNNILPLKNSVKKIALIGPLAKNKIDVLGSWNGRGRAEDVISIFEGLEEAAKSNSINISYAKGCDFDGNDNSGFEEAAKIAQDADVIVLCLGEKASWSGENASRSTLALPAIQEQLAASLQKTGKKIILVLSNGRPLELARLEPLADAIVETWQLGVMSGPAIANVLLGKVNPSGKLAITFPLTTGQIPMYYSMRQSARPTDGRYQDIPHEPLYWFGHGLSYSKFVYDTVKISAKTLKKTGKLTATVNVRNTSNIDGKETVLWFLTDPVASISRPMKQLKFFEKKNIPARATVTYTFEINPIKDLSFPNSDGKELLETGDFFVIVNNQKIPFELVD